MDILKLFLYLMIGNNGSVSLFSLDLKLFCCELFRGYRASSL